MSGVSGSVSRSQTERVGDLRRLLACWHTVGVLPPWVIQELEEERRRREEDERARSHRIELPQVTEERAEEARSPLGGVMIIDISPRDENVLDL